MQYMLRCANCGTEWVPSALQNGADAASCPVCHYTAEVHALVPDIRSREDFEQQLSALVTAAWSGGVESEQILHMLRDELAFAAELANAGHQFSVQLIDLGVQTGEMAVRPIRDRREMLQSRSVNG